MKIALIGTIVNDSITFADGSERRSLGGLLYAINAMLAAMGENDTLIPISYIGNDIYDEVMAFIESDRRVSSAGLLRCDRKNNWVQLDYFDAAERIEYSRDVFPPLTFQQIQPFLDADIVIVNMISGWDIDEQSFRKIRKEFSGLLALDAHSLTLGRANDGRRFRRPVNNINSWLSCCDVVQCNEAEFAAMGGNVDDPEIFYKQCCFKHGSLINLTLSARGSVTLWKNGNHIEKKCAAPPAAIEVIDPTGCGDAFMAGFIGEYYRSRDRVKAARQANLLAALSGSFRGLPSREILKKRFAQFIAEVE